MLFMKRLPNVLVERRTSAVARPIAAGTSLARGSIQSFATAPRMVIPPQMTELGMTTACPINEAKSLHPRFYTDEGYVSAEVDNIFGTTWFAACHTAEVSKPGDVKVLDVGGTSFIISCDRKGKLHAFYNFCRHRGAKVCSKSQTSCKQLVCPYHWWAYRLDGSLKATPPAVTPKQRKEELGLKPVPGMEIFAGMVFLNQNPNPPPLTDILGDLPAKLARYDLDAMELWNSKDYEIKGNWKLIAENFVDFYHINAVHPQLAEFSRVDDHLPYQGMGNYVGFVTAPLTDCGGAGDSYKFNRFPRLNQVESTAALFFQIFPNVSYTIYPHSVYTLMTFPTDTPGVTKERLTLLMAPDAKLQKDETDTYSSKCDQLLDFVVTVNDEDVVAIENLQIGLRNAAKNDIQGEFLPKYDWPIHRFQNQVLATIRDSPIDESIMPKLDTEFEQSVITSA